MLVLAQVAQAVFFYLTMAVREAYSSDHLCKSAHVKARQCTPPLKPVDIPSKGRYQDLLLQLECSVHV